MSHSSTSSEVSFHELPSKGKRPSIRKQVASSLSSQLIVLVFTKQPYGERYLTNFFCEYFCELLENCSSASKHVPKGFRKFIKKHPCNQPTTSLMLVKLQTFTGAATGCILWKGALRKVFAKITRKGLCQRLYFSKVAFLGLYKRDWHKYFPVNLAKFLRKCFLQNTSGRQLLFLAFQKQSPEVLYEKRCSWKFRKILRKTPLVCKLFKITFFATSSGFFVQRY